MEINILRRLKKNIRDYTYIIFFTDLKQHLYSHDLLFLFFIYHNSLHARLTRCIYILQFFCTYILRTSSIFYGASCIYLWTRKRYM